eukprot:scaffold4337_cov182-Ochromonas_danica.AAC.1
MKADCSVCSKAELMAYYLAELKDCQTADCSVSSKAELTVYCLVEMKADQMADCSVCSKAELMAYYLAEMKVCQTADCSVCSKAEQMVYRSAEMKVCQRAGRSVSLKAELMVYCSVEMTVDQMADCSVCSKAELMLEMLWGYSPGRVLADPHNLSSFHNSLQLSSMYHMMRTMKPHTVHRNRMRRRSNHHQWPSNYSWKNPKHALEYSPYKPTHLPHHIVTQLDWDWMTTQTREIWVNKENQCEMSKGKKGTKRQAKMNYILYKELARLALNCPVNRR